MMENFQWNGKVKGIPYGVVISKELIAKGDIHAILTAVASEFDHVIHELSEIFSDEKVFQAAQEGKSICRSCHADMTVSDMDTHPHCKSCFDKQVKKED